MTTTRDRLRLWAEQRWSLPSGSLGAKDPVLSVDDVCAFAEHVAAEDAYAEQGESARVIGELRAEVDRLRADAEHWRNRTIELEASIPEELPAPEQADRATRVMYVFESTAKGAVEATVDGSAWDSLGEAISHSTDGDSSDGNEPEAEDPYRVTVTAERVSRKGSAVNDSREELTTAIVCAQAHIDAGAKTFCGSNGSSSPLSRAVQVLVNAAKAQHPDVAAIQAEAKRDAYQAVVNQARAMAEAAKAEGNHNAMVTAEYFANWAEVPIIREERQPTPSNQDASYNVCRACGGTQIIEFRTNAGTSYNVDCNTCAPQPTASKPASPLPPPTTDEVRSATALLRRAGWHVRSWLGDVMGPVVDGLAEYLSGMDTVRARHGHAPMGWDEIEQATRDFVTHGGDRT